MVTTAVLYHGGCPDGWTAAWAAYHGLGTEPTLIPVSHGDPPPDLEDFSEVFIVDFSYPHEILNDLTLNGIRRVVVLDHHRTAIDALGVNHAEADYEVLLDTKRSGAGITWDYFNPGIPRPPLVDYVEDRDLWNNALPYSGVISAYIRTQPYNLETWDRLAKAPTEDMITIGAGVVLHIDAYCRAVASQMYMCKMGDRTFPIVNVPYESCSDVANYILEMGFDMAGYFFQKGSGWWQYGFRSRNGVTVHDFAETFGGGGHRQASGCVLPELVHTRIEA